MIKSIKLLFTLVLFTSCLHDSALAEETSVTIGAVYPLSGAAAHLGKSDRRGAEIAMELINEADGINGKQLKIIFEDSQSEPRVGVSAFQKLASIDKVPAVLTSLTSVSMAIKPIADRHKVVMIASSGHPALLEDSLFTFRHCATSDSAATEIVNFISKNNFKKIAILHAEEEIGVSAANNLIRLSKDKQFSIVVQETFAKDQTDLRSQMVRIKNANPEMLYIVGLGAPVSAAFRQRVELGLNIPTAGYLVCGQDQIMKSASRYLDNVFSVDTFTDKSSLPYQSLEKMHQLKYPEDRIDQSEIAAFDAVNIIANALRSGASTGPEIREALIAAETIPSATGPVNFTEARNSVVPMSIYKILNGTCSEVVDLDKPLQ